jgi:uncharacterized protein (DUF433 family)
MSAVMTDRITRTPGVCGGKACIEGHRIRVMDIAIMYEHQGMSAEEIVEQYPSITLGDVHAALAYYYDNIEEIREDIRRNNEVAEMYRSQFPSKLKEKLNRGRD